MARRGSEKQSEKGKTGNEDKLRVARISVHLVAMCVMSYGVYYDFMYITIPVEWKRSTSFGGKLKYLTMINAILQAVYYTIALINDLIGTIEVQPSDKLPAIRRLKDYLFCALAFPVAMNVGTTFWSLMAIDRELVFPKAFDSFFPGWLNHVLHTNIMIFIVLELFTSFREYQGRKQGLTGLFSFMAAYLVWLHIIKYYSGIWVYPVLEVLPFPLRIVFFVVVIAATAIFYVAGEFMNNLVWTKELKQLKQSKRK